MMVMVMVLATLTMMVMMVMLRRMRVMMMMMMARMMVWRWGRRRAQLDAMRLDMVVVMQCNALVHEAGHDDDMLLYLFGPVRTL